MLIASLLFGISASLDALLVGISYGIRRVRIRLWQNLAISLVTLLGTCFSVGLGHRLAALLPEAVGTYAGSLVLILLGLYYIVRWTIALFQRSSVMPHRPLEREDCEPALSLKLPEVFTLSLTLSLNNLSAGLSASLAGLPLVPAAIATFACSVLFLAGGNRLGGSHGLQLAGCAAEPVSGVLLVVLGVVWLFW